MKRIQKINLINTFYLLPTIRFWYETGYYFAIELLWLKWGVEINVKNNEQ